MKREAGAIVVQLPRRPLAMSDERWNATQVEWRNRRGWRAQIEAQQQERLAPQRSEENVA